MARMLPSVIDPDCPSPGEKKLFEALRDDPATEEWTVLHSLNIAQHIRQIQGEADFVALIPQRGVLCIEVKAHMRVRREDSAWYLGRDPVNYRGPFQQASEACHSLESRVKSENPHLGSIPFAWVVAFTHAEAAVQQVRQGEWLSCQMLTADQIWDEQGVGSVLQSALDGYRHHLGSTPSVKTWFDPDRKVPKEGQIKELVRILRPDFEICETPATAAKKRADEIRRFTEEQFGALDSIEFNPRVLFQGPAGTGKTVLALEAARRLGASGQQVALVCYNRLLGRWLAEQASGFDGVSFVGTIDRLLMDVLEVDRVSKEELKRLPGDALDLLTAPGGPGRQFDALVVDEAQDVVLDRYADVLETLLNRGLATGTWYVFGDFEKQALFAGEDQVHRAVERLVGGDTSPRAARFPLSINCRNTPRIAEFLRLLGRPGTPYSRVLRPDDHNNVRTKFWGDAEAQVSMLKDTLTELAEEGYHSHDIVVLSGSGSGPSVAEALGRSQPDLEVAEFGDQALDYLMGLEGSGTRRPPGLDGHSRDRPSSVGYTTVGKFKGLESPVVVLTDFKEISSEGASALFYTGITRATERLVVLLHESTREDYLRILEDSASGGHG